MNIPRWIFSINLALGFLWLLGFITESIIKKEPSVIMLLTEGILLSIVVSSLIFKKIPNFLKKNKENSKSIIKYYILNSIYSYFLLIPIFALSTYAVAFFFGNIHSKDFITFIILFSIWMPLWWFVPVGLSIGWYKYIRNTNKDV